MSDDDRLNRLEVTLDKLADKIDKLTDVIVQQAVHSERIDRLEAQCTAQKSELMYLNNTARYLKVLVIVIPSLLIEAYPMIRDFLNALMVRHH